MTARVRAWRLATALAALGLVFMGAIVVPVFLVPALTAVLALGLAAEARYRSPRPALDVVRESRSVSATRREFTGLT
jgi:hypothetical protein